MSHDNKNNTSSEYFETNREIDQPCPMNRETESSTSQPYSASATAEERKDMNSIKFQASADEVIEPMATAQSVATKRDEDDEPSFNEGSPSHVFRRSNALSDTQSKVTDAVDDTGDISTNIMRNRKRDIIQCIRAPSVLESPQVGSDSLRSGIDTTFETIFGLPRPIQSLESAFTSLAFINPIQNTVALDSLMIKNENVYDKFKKKVGKVMKIQKDHGLVHNGGSIGQVSWVAFCEKKRSFNDMVLRGGSSVLEERIQTRAVIRSRRCVGLIKPVVEVIKKKPGHDVFDFPDDNDFVDDDYAHGNVEEMACDPDVGVEEMTKKGRARSKGKGKGRGKIREKSSTGKVGRGRGRGNVVQFFCPSGTENAEANDTPSRGNDLSPLSATCEKPGLSGHWQNFWGNGSSPRNKQIWGICPMCNVKFESVWLKWHAATCQG